MAKFAVKRTRSLGRFQHEQLTNSKAESLMFKGYPDPLLLLIININNYVIYLLIKRVMQTWVSPHIDSELTAKLGHLVLDVCFR